MRIVAVPHTGTNWLRRLLEWRMGVDLGAIRHVMAPWMRFPGVERGEKAVIPLRDPLLARISALNRREDFPVRCWRPVVGWSGLENVHFFRVDVSEDARCDEIRGLADFLACKTPESVDWTPVHTSEDVTGLKNRYLDGEIAAEIADDARFLAETPEIAAFFREKGYDTPWMN